MIHRKLLLADWEKVSVLMWQRREKEIFKKALLEKESLVYSYGNEVDNIGAVSGIAFLDVDTLHFGFKSGKLLNPLYVRDPSIPKEKIIKLLLQEASREGFLHISAKCPSDDTSYVKTLIDSGFYIVLCNIILKRKLLDEEVIRQPLMTRFATLDDIEALQLIACQSFSNNTRFHLDPHLSGQKSTEFHGLWIERLLKNKDIKVWCAELDSKIVGFVTSQILEYSDIASERIGYIDLIAVAESYRRRGIGSALIDTLLTYLKGKVQVVMVDTESINYSALRLYQKNGFSVSGSRFVLHKWMG